MAKPNEDGIDLNLSQSATDSDLKEFDPILTEAEKAAETKKEQSGGEEDDEDDETSSGVKTSQEELEAGTDAEKHEARERNKAGRLNQRQRQKQRIETLERQLANAISMHQEVSSRVQQLENTNQGTQFAQLQRAEEEAAGDEISLKNIIADASVKGDGIRVAEATQGLIRAQQRREMIGQAKEAMQAEARRPKTQPLDSDTVSHARAFMAENPWYKGPKSTDQDSRIMSSIDNTMTNEGWDPKSPTYWLELKTRAKKYLGHRFESQNLSQTDSTRSESGYNPPTEQRQTTRSPVAGGGSNNSEGGGGSSPKYRLNSERVKAMKEAGYWDDPKKRASVIKRYQEADRANTSNS